MPRGRACSEASRSALPQLILTCVKQKLEYHTYLFVPTLLYSPTDLCIYVLLRRNFGKQIRKDLQIRFHNVTANPAPLYGSECWTLRQKDRNRINSSQMEFIHSLTGVTLRDRIKSEDLRNRWRVHKMVQEVQNYQFKWMQHVLRMPANSLPRKLLKYKPHGRRDLGIPHRRWTDQFV
jgi:hypothetical protein